MVGVKNSPLILTLLLLSIAVEPLRSQPATPPHVFFRVEVGRSVPGPVSGRLLIFVKPGSGDQQVDNDQFHPGATWVAAREIENVKPGSSIEVEAGESAYPKPFSSMPAGDYEAQAVLDVGHSYNYGGRAPEDWVSSVIRSPIGLR
jgi:hypothetical protein